MSEEQGALNEVRALLARSVALSGLSTAELAPRVGVAEHQLVAMIDGPGPLDLEILLALLGAMRIKPLLFFSLALDESGGEGLLQRLLEAVSEALDHERRETLERHLEEEVLDETIPRTTDRELQVLLRRLVGELSEE